MIVIISERTKPLGQVLSDLATVGKQMQGFSNNVSLTNRLLKGDVFAEGGERLNQDFGVRTIQYLDVSTIALHCAKQNQRQSVHAVRIGVGLDHVMPALPKSGS